MGVFVALAAGSRVTLLEGRLYLPEAWCEDSARCEKAKIPVEKRAFQTKPQLLLDMVRTQRRRGVRFNWVSADGLYGNDPAFLRALDADGETFVADVHSSQRIWSEDPRPAAPGPRAAKSRAGRATAVGASVKVSDWIARAPAGKWTAFKRREGINGPLRGEFLHERIFVWDGKETDAQHWHLIAWRPAESPGEIKYVMSNARGDIASLDLARMSASRFWIERALQDAKGAVGMAEYQMRSWVGWHRHMTMVMLAMPVRPIRLRSGHPQAQGLAALHGPRTRTGRRRAPAFERRRHHLDARTLSPKATRIRRRDTKSPRPPPSPKADRHRLQEAAKSFGCCGYFIIQ